MRKYRNQVNSLSSVSVLVKTVDNTASFKDVITSKGAASLSKNNLQFHQNFCSLR